MAISSNKNSKENNSTPYTFEVNCAILHLSVLQDSPLKYQKKERSW